MPLVRLLGEAAEMANVFCRNSVEGVAVPESTLLLWCIGTRFILLGEQYAGGSLFADWQIEMSTWLMGP